MHIAVSINNVTVRLTDERWLHITTGHPETADYLFEILETVQSPDIVYEGNEGGLIATKLFPDLSDKFVVVIYKEVTDKDGFIITAYVSNKKQEFEKKAIAWKPSN